MNIQQLKVYLDEFDDYVINSGFRRDLNDYVASLPAASNNILALREIAEKVNSTLKNIHIADLPDRLKLLLPGDKAPQFTSTSYIERLDALEKDPEMPLEAYSQQLTEILNEFKGKLNSDLKNIESVKAFIAPYLENTTAKLADDQHALISIVFNEKNTITNLDKLARSFTKWNKYLPVYHQLVKSDPPKNVEVVEVQNGSVDLIVNLNVDVALDLAELFQIGFKIFGAYLIYKKLAGPIIESYNGNKELIDAETIREKLMLDNIKISVAKKINEQHLAALDADKSIDKTAIPKKVEQITVLVTDHIVNGNDYRVLELPAHDEGEDNNEVKAITDSLKHESTESRHNLKLIAPEDRQKLIELYSKDVPE